MRHRIKQFRLEKKLTQEKMADMMHLSKGYIYQIEAGKQPISDRFIDDMCRILGTNEKWLRTGEGPMVALESDEDRLIAWAAQHITGESSDFKRRFVRALIDLEDDDWAVIQKFVEKISKAPDE